MKTYKIIIAVCIIALGMSCSKDGGVNIFSVQDDKQLGKQLDSTILADPTEYPVLNKAQNPEVYAYVEGIMNKVLASEHIFYRNEFNWQVRIIDKEVLNAFAAPGGYLYFYTGFLKFCKSEAELAGVMAHEIAHSDRRHSSKTLTKVYGVQMLWGLLFGNNKSQLAEVAGTIATNGAALSFSRDHEYEADEYSLRYLESIKDTRNYDPMAILDFFDNLKAADENHQSNGSLDFLRTHPYDDDRKASLMAFWTELGEPKGNKYEDEHAAIISKL